MFYSLNHYLFMHTGTIELVDSQYSIKTHQQGNLIRLVKFGNNEHILHTKYLGFMAEN